LEKRQCSDPLKSASESDGIKIHSYFENTQTDTSSAEDEIDDANVSSDIDNGSQNSDEYNSDSGPLEDQQVNRRSENSLYLIDLPHALAMALISFKHW